MQQKDSKKRQKSPASLKPVKQAKPQKKPTVPTQKMIVESQHKEDKKQSNEYASTPQIKLYVYGSKQSDQFYLPNDKQETKRPFCLSALKQFEFEDSRIIPNPLFKAKIYQIACGSLHTVILTASGQVFTFGCNDEGALGRKGQQCIPVKVQLEDPVDLISAGDNHSLFANSVNGAIYFTGNYNFQRGQKMTDSVFQPIKFFAQEIDNRNRGKPIDKIASGANHSVILVNKRLFCRGEPESFTTGRRINDRRKTQSSLTFDGVGLDHVVDVWCGGYHSVAKVYKSNTYSYYAWGSNGRGQLGINSYQPSPFPVQIYKLRGMNIIKMGGGTHFTQFLTQDGQILSCGSNQNGNLGLGQDFTYEQHLSDLSEGQIKYREKMNKKQQKQKSQEAQKQDEQKEQKELEKRISENLVISAEKIELFMPQSAKINDKNGMMVVQNAENQGNEQAKQTSKKQQVVENNQDKMESQENKLYVKSLRRVVFQDPPYQPIKDITCGSHFTLAWNQTSLYTWGFAMNYVLLNGSQDEDQHVPFKVKDKILNNEIIKQISAGTQHVVYLAYQNESKAQESIKKVKVPEVFLDSKVRDRQRLSNYKLSKKRKGN